MLRVALLLLSIFTVKDFVRGGPAEISFNCRPHERYIIVTLPVNQTASCNASINCGNGSYIDENNDCSLQNVWRYDSIPSNEELCKVTVSVNDSGVGGFYSDFAVCSFTDNLGPPMITLNCSTNYVTARRSINATWRLQSFLPSDILIDRYNPIPDCFISITCGNGYTDRNSTCSKTAKQYGWRFNNIPLIEQSCNVTIAYDYSEDFQSLWYSGSANCSFPNAPVCCKHPDIQLTVDCTTTPGVVQLQWHAHERPLFGFCVHYSCRQPSDGNYCGYDNDQQQQRCFNKYEKNQSHSLTVEEFGITDGESCWFWIKDIGIFGIEDNGCSEVIHCNLNSTSATEGIDIKPKIQSITENPVVGYFYEIQCIVEERINFVSINWIGPDGAAILNDSRISIANTIAGNNHTSILQFAYLKETDNGSYNCNVAIQNITFSTESFMLNDLNKNAPACCKHPDIQLTVDCTTTPEVVGLQWHAHQHSAFGFCVLYSCRKPSDGNYCSYDNDQLKQKCFVLYEKNQSHNLTVEELGITDGESCWFWIKDAGIFGIDDNGCSEVIHCNEGIDYKPKIQSITENPVVGYFYEIQCVVEEHINFVSINWIGPDGAAIVNNSRINITNNIVGNNHTNILQFAYLKETDNGSYNCNVAMPNNIFFTESFMLKDLKIPTPIVSVTATNNNPTIGKSFSMECNVTVAKGIIGNVEIIWAVNGTVKRRVTDTVEANDSQYVLHRDVYNIPLLHASNNNTVYCCKAVINARENLESNSSITLTIVSDAISSKMITVSPTSTDTITLAPASKCKDRSSDHVAVIISSIVVVILVILIAFLLGYCTYKMLIRRKKKLNFTKQVDDDTAVSTI